MKQNVASYAAPFKLGDPFLSHAVSRVIKSNADGYKTGDLVYLRGYWESYTVYADASKVPELRVVTPAAGIPLSYYIGSLGMPGMTAWAGLMVLAHPKAGETLFVSAASGAVGQSVVQYGKKAGLHVVGSAGSDDKCEFVAKELHADACFNYKKPPGGSIGAALKEACPKGIDINFENVGGETYEEVLKLMNKQGRVSVCGWISAYHSNVSVAQLLHGYWDAFQRLWAAREEWRFRRPNPPFLLKRPPCSPPTNSKPTPPLTTSNTSSSSSSATTTPSTAKR